MKKKDLWNGKQYKDNSSPQEQSAINILNSISFKDDDCILDIGCGDGKITQRLCSLSPKGQIIGIDASSSMISEANKRACSYSNLSFFNANAENFRIDMQFNYILSFNSLHWVKDKSRMFNNVSNHLKPNGKFIFITAGRENHTISSVFSSKQWQDKIGKHGHKFHAGDSEKINHMLVDSGLFVESSQAEYRSSYYAKHEDLVNWIMTWVPYATGLDNEESIIFANEIAENVKAQSISEGIEDRIEFKTEMLIVTACKE
jgi:trans-aconitate 2-methyltransferase